MLFARGSPIQQVQSAADRCQVVAQVVRQHSDELFGRHAAAPLNGRRGAAFGQLGVPGRVGDPVTHRPQKEQIPLSKEVWLGRLGRQHALSDVTHLQRYGQL